MLLRHYIPVWLEVKEMSRLARVVWVTRGSEIQGFLYCHMTGAEFRSIIYLARLVKAVKTSHPTTKRISDGICGWGWGGRHIDFGSGILLYKHHASLSTTVMGVRNRCWFRSRFGRTDLALFDYSCLELDQMTSPSKSIDHHPRSNATSATKFMQVQAVLYHLYLSSLMLSISYDPLSLPYSNQLSTQVYCPPAALARSITPFSSSAASTNAFPNFSASLFLVVMHHLMWSSWIA